MQRTSTSANKFFSATHVSLAIILCSRRSINWYIYPTIVHARFHRFFRLKWRFSHGDTKFFSTRNWLRYTSGDILTYYSSYSFKYVRDRDFEFHRWDEKLIKKSRNPCSRSSQKSAKSNFKKLFRVTLICVTMGSTSSRFTDIDCWLSITVRETEVSKK